MKNSNRKVYEKLIMAEIMDKSGLSPDSPYYDRLLTTISNIYNELPHDDLVKIVDNMP